MNQSISRRTMLKLGTVGLAGIVTPSFYVENEKIHANPFTFQKAKPTGLLHNEDCTDFFRQNIPDGKAAEIVDSYIDILAGAGVSILMCNTNSRRTNYRSKVWEAFWDGYNPDGADNQPFMAAVPQNDRETYRKIIGNMYEVYRQGVDYPAQVIKRCRHHGISPWISLRMNDVHNNDNLDHPFHSPLWRKPELFRQGHPGYFSRALDFAHAEVRDHYQALIVETLERYDIDGLELDFMREPYLFSKGKEQDGRKILTEWMHDIRSIVDDASKRLGHAVKIGVRVPSDPDTAIGLGLDAPAWAKKRMVDLVVPSPRWATLEFSMPMKKWRELIGDRVTLAGGLEVLYQPNPHIPVRYVAREDATGAAIAVLTGGADVVYLYNFFQMRSGLHWSISEYQSMLKSFASLDELLKLPRRHAITYRDVIIPGDDYIAPLPASGVQLSFPLPLGPIPVQGWLAEATIEIAALHDANSLPGVSINGIAGKFRTKEILKNGNFLIVYALPNTAISGINRDTIEVMAAKNDTVKVQRVEVSMHP
jgi:hypothetical protein